MRLLHNKVLQLSKKVLNLRHYENLYYERDKECAVLKVQLKKKNKALSLSTFLVIAEAIVILLMVWL